MFTMFAPVVAATSSKRAGSAWKYRCANCFFKSSGFTGVIFRSNSHLRGVAESAVSPVRATTVMPSVPPNSIRPFPSFAHAAGGL